MFLWAKSGKILVRWVPPHGWLWAGFFSCFFSCFLLVTGGQPCGATKFPTVRPRPTDGPTDRPTDQPPHPPRIRQPNSRKTFAFFRLSMVLSGFIVGGCGGIPGGPGNSQLLTLEPLKSQRQKPAGRGDLNEEQKPNQDYQGRH